MGILRSKTRFFFPSILLVTLPSHNFSTEKSQLLGQILGDRYRIQSLLSQKAGRRTFIARDTQTDTTVIIKLLLFGNDFGWDDLKLFEREAAVLKSLDYPAIPRYLDYFDVETELGKGFALVQTYIEAKSLQEWVQSGSTFDEEQLQSIANSLLEILEYLHHQHPTVVHRDIKPSNILLSDCSDHSPSQVYLVDFGSVQTAVNTTSTITIVGTYGYMPPEQFGGKTSPASDLYALGATIIYLATGQHPAELPQADLRISFENQVILAPNFTEWLQWMTEPSLGKRAHSASAAKVALNQSRSIGCNYSSGTNKISGMSFRPAGSKVQIKRLLQKLKIVIPNEFNLPKIGRNVIQLFVASFCVFNGLVPSIFSAIPLLVFISCLWKIIVAVYGQIELCITPQRVFLNHQVFGTTYWQSANARVQDIGQIELTADRYHRGEKGAVIKIPAQVNIWAGVQQLGFGRELTKPELEWLAQECSVWLNLPVTRDNSTLDRAVPYIGPPWRK